MCMCVCVYGYIYIISYKALFTGSMRHPMRNKLTVVC